MRLFGVSESSVAKALEEAGGDGDGVDVTICAREFELHIDLFVQPGADARADEIERASRTQSGSTFSRDERSTAELVVDLLRDRHLMLATAESCTGGLVATRVSPMCPGRAMSFLGSIVA